jgi:uncharacterized protein
MHIFSREHVSRLKLLSWTFWFCLANLLFYLLIAVRYQLMTDLPTTTLAKIFTGLMFVGHFGLLSLIFFILTLSLILVFPRKRPVLSASIIAATAVVLLLFIDTIVYQLYRFHLNSAVLGLVFGGAGGEIFVFSWTMYAQAALIVLAVLFLELGIGEMLWRRQSRRKTRRVELALSTLLVIIIFMHYLLYVWADAAAYTPITKQARLLPFYQPVTARKFLRKCGMNIDDQKSPTISGNEKSDLQYPLRPLECKAQGALPNIVVMIIDSWRFDALNKETTPNVAELADRSAVFTDHYSGGNATRTGLFTLFYGIPGTYWHNMLREKRGPVLVSELLRRNYQMGIFGSAPLFSPEFDRTVFVEIKNLRLRSEGKGVSTRDKNITKDFEKFLDARTPDQPFFSMLFYDAPHAFAFPKDYPLVFKPSWPQVNYLELNNGFDAKQVRNRYLNSVHFVDSLAGKALGALKEHGLLDNTVIIVTGDHGQEFNENGLNYWGHNGNFSRYQTGVPLVFYRPGAVPQTYTYRTSHFDVAPTLMRELLGCRNEYSDYSVGHNLFEPGNRDLLLLANYADYAVVEPGKIDILQPFGIEILNEHYQPLTNTTPNPKLIPELLEEQSRFYKR